MTDTHASIHYYASEAPPYKIPVAWISEAVDRRPELETSSGKTITLNLLEKWRRNLE